MARVPVVAALDHQEALAPVIHLTKDIAAWNAALSRSNIGCITALISSHHVKKKSTIALPHQGINVLAIPHNSADIESLNSIHICLPTANTVSRFLYSNTHAAIKAPIATIVSHIGLAVRKVNATHRAVTHVVIAGSTNHKVHATVIIQAIPAVTKIIHSVSFGLAAIQSLTVDIIGVICSKKLDIIGIKEPPIV